MKNEKTSKSVKKTMVLETPVLPGKIFSALAPYIYYYLYLPSKIICSLPENWTKLLGLPTIREISFRVESLHAMITIIIVLLYRMRNRVRLQLVRIRLRITAWNWISITINDQWTSKENVVPPWNVILSKNMSSIVIWNYLMILIKCIRRCW